jgi:predicted nucleic acid-binding protein
MAAWPAARPRRSRSWGSAARDRPRHERPPLPARLGGERTCAGRGSGRGLVIAETDYLVLKRLGKRAERAFVAQLISGAIQREEVARADLERALAISRQFDDQCLGLTDAAVMALTERLETRKVLTLDRRHFAPFRDRRGRALELLP